MTTCAQRRPQLLVGLRAVLLAALLACAWQVLHDPVDAQLGDLQSGLARGSVQSVVAQVPRAGSTASGARVRWSTGGLRPQIATYDVSAGQQNPVLQAVASASARPRLTVEQDPFRVDPRMREGLPLAFGVVLGVLLLLRAGPAPVLATRWAWLWLMVLLPVSLVGFVVLEPAPLWRPGRPLRARGRLSGAVAFFAAAVVAAVGANLAPELTSLLWRRS